MKSLYRQLLLAVAMLALAGLATLKAQGYGYSYSARSLTTLTSQGVGPIELGVNPENLPSFIPGLYDRKIHINKFGNNVDKGWFSGWEFYDTDGNVVVQALLDNQGNIATIIVHGKNITTAEGFRVGQSRNNVLKNKGLQQTCDKIARFNYPLYSYRMNGIGLWLDESAMVEMYVGQCPTVSTRAKMYPDIPRDVIDTTPPPSAKKPVAKNTGKQQAATPSSKQGGTIITAKGIPPVVFGANPANLPASCKGVYARKSKEELWDLGDFMGYYWQFYDEKGRQIFRAEVDDKNKICGITVTTSTIPMENGMRVGMTRKQVEAYKGVKKYVPGKWADESYARISYEYGKYTLYMDWEKGNIVAEIEFGE